jgi:hypothetical protein
MTKASDATKTAGKSRSARNNEGVLLILQVVQVCPIIASALQLLVASPRALLVPGLLLTASGIVTALRFKPGMNRILQYAIHRRLGPRARRSLHDSKQLVRRKALGDSRDSCRKGRIGHCPRR